MKLCMGCMNEIEDSEHICPHCGYKEGTSVSDPVFLPPGTILQHKYVVGKVIGHGGFGITYIGYDCVLDRVVAIKEYFPIGLATRTGKEDDLSVYSGTAGSQYHAGLKSFTDEAKRLAKFSGTPAIVDIYDCFHENGTGYIVMEYLRGKTIKEMLIDGKKLPYANAEKMILSILEGLEVVHSANMIHRDISPDNVFVTESGSVKLLDFGAARFTVTNDQKSLSIILKPGFAPVEQYSSRGYQGSWTDIYAVGGTFYRMITGKRPVESLERIMGGKGDVLKKPSELGISIPSSKENVLMKSLAVQPQERIQTAKEFREMLLRTTDGYSGGSVRRIKGDSEETVKVFPDGSYNVPRSSGPEEERKKKKRGPVVGIIAVIIIAALLGSVFLLKPNKKKERLATEVPKQTEVPKEPETKKQTESSKEPESQKQTEILKETEISKETEVSKQTEAPKENTVILSGTYEIKAKCYLRSEPQIGDNVITSLPKGKSVELLAEESGWYKVVADGEEGYIGKAYISVK